MNANTTFPMLSKSPDDAAPLLRILSQHRREDIEAFIAIAIDLCDLADGCPDLENDDPAEEDDPSGQRDEDGCNTAYGSGFYAGPGCEISDTGERPWDGF